MNGIKFITVSHFSNIYPSKTLRNHTPDNSLHLCLCNLHFTIIKLNKICQKIVKLWFYTDYWNWNLKHFAPDNLLQLGLVQLHHIWAQSQICNTQYMFLTHADDLLCLQLHTVWSAYTVCASDPCWWLAVPTAAHSTVSIHSTCFWPMLMTCCAYSCTQYSHHFSLLRFSFDTPLYVSQVIIWWQSISKLNIPLHVNR